MNLTGKWKYFENYGYGVAEGELFLKQENEKLTGRIIFTDRQGNEPPYMIQEFLVGDIEGRKVKLEAKEFDIIHAEYSINYQLDSWLGILVDDCTIKGMSLDGQGFEGFFEFDKVEDNLRVTI